MQIPKQNAVAHFTGRGYVSLLQAEVVTILDCMTSCLRKRLVKEPTTIFTDSQVTVAAPGVSGTKSLHVVDCIKKLTALSEAKLVTIIWVPGHSRIQ